MVSDLSNFILIPGCIGGRIYFDATKRHFYNRDPEVENRFRCADSQFVLCTDPKEKEKRAFICQTNAAADHKHDSQSQEMMELVVIRWEWVLKMFNQSAPPNNLEIIESVLSSWPHQLSFTSKDIESKISRFLNFHRNRAADKTFVGTFLAAHDKEQLAHFRQVILHFRTELTRPGQFSLLISVVGVKY